MKKDFDKGYEQAQKSTVFKLQIIGACIDTFYEKKKYNRYIKAYNDFIRWHRMGKDFTPPQMAFIENIYEHLMKAAGYPACDVKHDPKRRSI